MKLQKLLIATHNRAKLQEFKVLLAHSVESIYSLDDLGIVHKIEETGTTFAQNALLKGHGYSDLADIPTLADDGGLEIIALNGWPGVYSAEVAGLDATDQQKIDTVLERIKRLPATKRQARFVGTIALVWPDGREQLYQAGIEGYVVDHTRGKLVQGFPYRTLFFLPDYGKTLAELDECGIEYESHRTKVLLAFLNDMSCSD
jgi:XTP/dITP diphosphohydrolase